MAAFPPMPSASVTTTVAAMPLTRISARNAKRRSRPSAAAFSKNLGRQTVRIESRVSVTLPNSFSAARRADSGSSPRSIRCLISIARWPRISSSSSSSRGAPPHTPAPRSRGPLRPAPLVASRSRASPLNGGMRLLLGRRCRIHDPSDGGDELGPSILLARQLRLARGREAVVLRALVRLAQIPFPFKPPALHEPMQSGVQGARFDLEQILGLRTDRLADAVAVLRSPLQRPADQHVERALQELPAFFVVHLA